MNRPENRGPDEPEQKSDDDMGRKGGAASMAGAIPATRAEVEAITDESVKWSSVWTGFVVSLPIQLVLSAIGIGTALRSYNPAAGDYGQRIANTVGMWSSISMLIALFIGGYVAARLASGYGVRHAWMQGTMVWALATLLGVAFGVLSGTGFAGAFSGIQSLTGRGIALTGTVGDNLVRIAANTAWWFVVGAVFSWITAVVGALVGTPSRPADR